MQVLQLRNGADVVNSRLVSDMTEPLNEVARLTHAIANGL